MLSTILNTVNVYCRGRDFWNSSAAWTNTSASFRRHDSTCWGMSGVLMISGRPDGLRSGYPRMLYILRTAGS